MASGAPGSNRPGSNGARRRRTPGAQRPAASRQPISRLLPESLLEELGRTAASVEAVTPDVVKALDDRLRIAERYGVSRRRLAKHLSGLKETLESHRHRQATVSAILDETFGQLATCKPELWDRRAYLMLVGLVYERLATNEEDLPTEELVALAKVLAESRRAQSRPRDSVAVEEAPGSKASRDGPLPDRFADIVRQIYGTDFQAPAAATADSPSADQNGGVGG